MRVVVVGDVGRPNFYHTGDEAMTEVAVELLRERGVDEVVLVASSPALATQLYGCPGVPRIRFSKKWTRERCEQRLAALDDELASQSPLDGSSREVIDAVSVADALLIAGGGNLRSEHRYMIYERLALVRVARHFGVPVCVTSQTVGPMLEPADEALVREIAEAARCFGAREPDTAALVRRLVGDEARVTHTMDDSVLLDPRPEDLELVAGLTPPGRYAVASFTYHAGFTGMSRPQYQRYLAGVLDALAERLDAEVLLVPHCGAFDPEIVTFDRENDAAVVAASGSGRLRALPLLTARQAIALTRGALLSVSTRYHATVFGTSQGVPSIGLVTSYYSSVRMTGALGNVGLSQFAIPAGPQSEQVLAEAVDEIVESPAVRQHLEQVVEARRSEQAAWWDALVAAMRAAPEAPPHDLAEAPQHRSGAWRLRVQDALIFADLAWRRHAELRRAQSELSSARAEIASLREKLTAVSRELGQARSRLARVQRFLPVRLIQRVRRLAKRG